MNLQDKGPYLEGGHLIQIFQHEDYLLTQLEANTGQGFSEKTLGQSSQDRQRNPRSYDRTE